MANRGMIMIKKRHFNPLIKGTLILTLTGVITRILGFFYRIYMSNLFGAKGVGIYQLISPILVLSFSLTAAGIQTAISKYTAQDSSKLPPKKVWFFGTILSVSLSFFCSVFLYGNAAFIAVHYLSEASCIPLIKIAAISFPFVAFHSCVNGYFYGKKKTGIPAFSQLLEQCVRILTVWVLSQYYLSHNKDFDISVAVIGLTAGEIASTLLSIIAIYTHFRQTNTEKPVCDPKASSNFSIVGKIITLSVPLSANRVILSFLQSVETVYIPRQLLLYGLSKSSALSIYGTLTGMALPFILFPSTLINSFCVLLLPYVSKTQESDPSKIRIAFHKTVVYSFLFGIFCTTGFFILGNYLGLWVFHSRNAGTFIKILGFLCPLLYINSTLSSFLNGLGKTHITFLLQVSTFTIRLASVFYGMPRYGMMGYLWGLLLSALLGCLLTYAAASHYTKSNTA